MNETAGTWALVVLAAGGGFVAAFVSKYTSNLLRGKSIKDVVDSANAIIEMYEKHVGALELKVGDLETQVTALSGKLDETLRHNIALQKLLLESPALKVGEVA